jgi:RimJ/RimL family protein N-acetyltransferase
VGGFGNERHADRVNTLIEGELVCLRRFERGDAEVYRGFVNDPEIARRVDRAGTVTAEEHAVWYEALVTSERADVFAVDEKASGTFIGLVWLYAIEPRHARAEVRIVLGRGHGRGCGTEALRLLVAHAFSKRALAKLWADVLAFNDAAARAFEKAGFVREGLLRSDRSVAGARVDVIRFGALNPKLA